MGGDEIGDRGQGHDGVIRDDGTGILPSREARRYGVGVVGRRGLVSMTTRFGVAELPTGQVLVESARGGRWQAHSGRHAVSLMPVNCFADDVGILIAFYSPRKTDA